jgi:hypothetical protein
MAPRSATAAAALALLAATASGKIHHLIIKNDPRYAFSIESFGFLQGGSVSIRVHDVAASPPDVHHMMGFVLYPTSTESRIAEQIDTLITRRQCALDAENEGIYIINASDPAAWKREAPLEVTIDRPGLYDLLFTHCEPAGGQTSFTVHEWWRVIAAVVAMRTGERTCRCSLKRRSSPLLPSLPYCSSAPTLAG